MQHHDGSDGHFFGIGTVGKVRAGEMFQSPSRMG